MLDALPRDIRASFERIAGLIQTNGLEQVHEPYVKHLEGPLWEMRLSGRSGIARAVYVTAIGKRVVVVHVFWQEDAKDAAARDCDRAEACEGGFLMRKYIPVEESFAEWRKDPEYVAAYDALEEEFALASALIKARGDADMTQEQVAQAMGTTQAVAARLESGKTMPSTRTLERFAKATGTKMRIRFEPVGGLRDQGVGTRE